MTDVRPDERMSDIDALVWAVEHDPRNRTTIAALARFDGPIDGAALRHRVDRASRVVERLRQRVVSDPNGIGAPRWSVDPTFRLSHHLRRARMSDGSDARLAELVRDIIVQPFDRSRPLWEFTVIDGLDDGGSALLLKAHHAVSDGVGGVEMMLELFDLDSVPEPDRAHLPAAPVPAPFAETVVGTARDEARRALRQAGAQLDALLTPRSAPEVLSAARRMGETLGAAFTMFRPSTEPPVVPADRSAGLDLRFFAVDLDDLRSAGRRVGGTVNTAFVTAVALGVHDHARSTHTRSIRLAVPISTREDDAGRGGNHWAPSRVDIDVDPAADPDHLATAVRDACAGLRDDPAHALVPLLAAGLKPLPDTTTAALFGAASSGVDVAASNVPGSPVPLHLCGRPVRELIPFGPLSGAAVNVTLMSYAGTAHIGVSSDPAAITEPDRLRRNLETAFTAVVKGS